MTNRAAPFRHIVLPLEFDPDRADLIDWRKEKGELLSPERFGETYWESRFANMPIEVKSAQYNQIPVASGMGLFKPEEFRFWETWDDLPSDGVWGMSLDPAQKGRAVTKVAKAEAERSYWVCQAWLRSGTQRALLGQVRFRDDFAVALSTISTFAQSLADKIALHRRVNGARWSPGVFLVEEQAAGPQAISVWKATGVPGGLALEAWQTGTKTKLERAEACLPTVRGGAVWLPKEGKPAENTGCSGLLSRLCTFPRGKFDDEIDAMAQILLYWVDENYDFRQMMKNLRKLRGS